MSNVWLLADERPGNVNQALGVAEKLGLPVVRKDIRYTRLADLPNLLLGRSLLGLDADSRAAIAPPWPDVVINAGRRGAPVLRYLKRHAPSVVAVQLMWPDAGIGDFDLIAVPEHDRRRLPPNGLVTVGSPHHLTPEKLARAAGEWKDTFASLPRPYLGILLGGKHEKGDFIVEDGTTIGDHASAWARRTGGSVLATTSRRTGPAMTEALEATLHGTPHYLYRWAPDTPNPYLALMSIADELLVSGDSMSMCSEACALGKPVEIYAPPHLANGKHARLHQSLYERGYARTCGEPMPGTPPPALDAAGEVARAVRALLDTRR